jgi:hypothetical protein
VLAETQENVRQKDVALGLQMEAIVAVTRERDEAFRAGQEEMREQVLEVFERYKYAPQDRAYQAAYDEIRRMPARIGQKAGPHEPDLSKCPRCGGPADNGNDREHPPNPYVCTKCERSGQDSPEGGG